MTLDEINYLMQHKFEKNKDLELHTDYLQKLENSLQQNLVENEAKYSNY